MSEFPDHAQLANIALIEELYSKYLKDPTSVETSWRHFFEGIDFASLLYKKPAPTATDARIADLIAAYRKFGHLKAKFNPLEQPSEEVDELKLEQLGFFESEMDQVFPTLGFCGKKEAPLREILAALETIYCNTIGFECTDLGNLELEKWIRAHLEPQGVIQPSIEEKHLLLEYLNKSEVFETFLHTKYVGQTRFSLEGAETMIPLLAEIIEFGGELGVEEFLIGMAHRGRLNVLVNLLDKPLSLIFEEFEDDTALSFSGNDDVRYHMGFVGQMKGKNGIVSLAANPSHLESVDPVVLGQTYAKQIVKNDTDKSRTCPILIHGDASVAGQGVVYESMQLMNLPSYSVGGTIHLVVNNQIGYTTLPKEGRSTRYCTDIAKAFGAPVFHVNAEDPEGCLFAAKLASEIRQKFHVDVFIDLLCYRKYGHNEGDEPSFTQPVEYALIHSKKSIRQIYCEKLMQEGHLEQKLAEALEVQFKDAMKRALETAKEKIASKVAESATLPFDPFEPLKTSVDLQTAKTVLETFCKVPEGFHFHPKLQKWLEKRLHSINETIDWATAECLAFGSLLMEGVPIRLAGQDSQRGTFSQRHMVWINTDTGEPYSPLSQLKTRIEIVNSALTEYAGMGFEVGFSWILQDSLNLWEAQYGDFYNGAQIIVDQYLANAEQKWGCTSSLTLLLPHGYEGAGPEHSSARIERFLQLCACNNMQVVFPTTPAQYFHLLRRQALRKVKKPLIVFTPKSLLRAPENTSQIDLFTKGQFSEILDDPAPPASCKRIIFCSGKIFYGLMANRKRDDIAIIRIEQLYPLNEHKLKEVLAKYKGFTECFWVQEEPENMGAWRYIRPYLPNAKYVGRAENATTATGSNRKHKQDQQILLEKALK